MNDAESVKPILPVVIVGRNRTAMTAKVAEYVVGKLGEYEPYVIHVSDGSRPGHAKYIREFLARMNIKGEVVETTTKRYGWGAAMNIGLEMAFSKYGYALLLDNDWLLQKDLPIAEYVSAMETSDIGAITFKQICQCTNVSTEERDVRGRTYMYRKTNMNNQFSYALEIGCLLMSKPFFLEIGMFKENETNTGKVEFECAYRYGQSLVLGSARRKVVTDKEFYHTELNGEGHVFTHVGLNSSQIDHPTWYVPEEYVYLSDEKTDRILCAESFSINAPAHEDGVNIDWRKYFDRIICVSFHPKSIYRECLRKEFARLGILDSGIFEMRYTVPTKHDDILFEKMKNPNLDKKGYMNAALEINRAVKSALLDGCERIWLLEDDVAFLKDKSQIVEILDDLPRRYGVVQLSKFVFPGHVKWTVDNIKENRISNCFFGFKQGDCLTDGSSIVLNRAGMEEWVRIQEECLTTTDCVYRMITCGVAASIKNISVQVFDSGCENLNGNMTPEQLHWCYRSQGIDYSEYNVPDGYGIDKTYSNPNIAGERRKSSKGRKFISVYAIAKNESKFAKRWYECMSEADEVCVLDTGSTDDTVKILSELGAKVTVKKYEKWRFDTARNDSMNLVSPDADILVTTDIDETIKPGWRKKLEDAWIGAEAKGLKPTNARYKYVWSYNPDGTEAQFFEVHKIHAKGACVWKHRIHEYPSYGSNQVAVWIPDFVVEHHQDPTKSRSFYLDLLKEEALEAPEDDRSAHYYGRELMYVGRFADAIEELKRHLSLPSAGWRAERAASMRYIARCYGKLGDADNFQLWMYRSADEDPTNREATYELGEFFLEKHDYRSALVCLKRCVAIEKPSLEYISLPHVWTAKPYVLLSQALWWNGDWKGAEEMVRAANSMEPDNKEIKAQMEGMVSTRKKFGR